MKRDSQIDSMLDVYIASSAWKMHVMHVCVHYDYCYIIHGGEAWGKGQFPL